MKMKLRRETIFLFPLCVATVETFGRMEIRVRHTDRSKDAWVLKGTGETVELHAELAPVTPRMTKVSLRVEAGGLQADKRTAEEILNQVALSLERQPAVAVLADAPRDAAPLVPVKVLTHVRPLGGKQTIR